MGASLVSPFSAVLPDFALLGWIAAAIITCAWLTRWWLQRRSSARFVRTMNSGEVAELDGYGYPLLEPLASSVIRRLRADRTSHAALAQRLEEIERVLRAMPIAVISLDHQQRVLSANPAAQRLLSIDASSARGRLLQDSVRQPNLNDALKRAFASGGSLHCELHLEFESPLEVQLSCEPLHLENQPGGLVLSLVDVTRMRRLESMRSEFAANVSHELRTPITNIKGYVETLLAVGMDDPEQSRRFLEIVHRNTARLSGIVEDILTLAFLEEPDARRSLVKEPVDARDLVKQVIEDLGVAAARRSVRVIDACDAQTVMPLVCHRALTEQAIANFLSNAIKYSKDGTLVTVLAVREGGSVRFSVTDTGPGIAAKHLPRIFERFYRVDPSRARAQGATGLGLAIVKHIATIHGGSVEVTSQVGDGCRFSLLLPAAE